MATLQATKYSISKEISGSFDDAMLRVKGAFQAEGFGVMSEINMQKALDEKIGRHIEPYTILGMCHPQLASRALDIEHEIGLLLPCNVLVHECEGAVHVSVQDPTLLMDLVGNEKLHPIAKEAREKIERSMQLL
jgi:uncharacterized protein (DUF302 family)